MPPWLADIHAGLQSLHTKADQQYADITVGLQNLGTRIANLEGVASEHLTRHDRTDSKIKTLEAKIAELQASHDALSRSPRQSHAYRSGSRSPRSPVRSPRHSAFAPDRDDFADEEPDFDIVIGGWCDARRDDAIEEVRNILQDAKISDQITEVWAPYSRTSFVKLRIFFDPMKPSGLSAKRSKQKELIDVLKSKQYVSGIPGSEKSTLWATRSKTPEERLKTRAIVLTKEFYSNLPSADPNKGKMFAPHNIDIVWTGKVFISRFQLLGNIHRDGEPSTISCLAIRVETIWNGTCSPNLFRS